MNKTLFCMLVSALVIMLLLGAYTASRAVDVVTDIEVYSYDINIDYMELMRSAAENGDKHALLAGAIYEKHRNLKITSIGLPYDQTSYFTDYTTGEEILAAMKANLPYTEEDLDLLARIIYAEAGSYWIPDRVQLLVGSVVLNRVNSDLFPDTIYDVIYQRGQYSPTWNGAINKITDERTIDNARRLLEEGSICPAGVLGQNSVCYGELYESYYDDILGSTIYFFYWS